MRPSYPAEVFDAVMQYGSLQAGDRAVEVGAGTGKATEKWMARGLDVLALEPSNGMAVVLRHKGVAVEEVTFEEWQPAAGAFRLLAAAQAWHWVTGDGRYEKAAAALAPGGTLAL